MAVVKYNNYIAPHDVVNLSNNVPIDIIGKDQSSISINFGTVPATVTIKKGSLIEHNNNYYYISDDESFQMANAGHEYIGFNGSSFSSLANIGTYDYDKIGFYNGNYRVLKYFIHQSGEWYNNLFEVQIGDEHFISIQHDHIKVGLSTDFYTAAQTWEIIPFDTIYFDDLGRWDNVNYEFICANSGHYIIDLIVRPEQDLLFDPDDMVDVMVRITKNGNIICDGQYYFTPQGTLARNVSDYLHAGDIIKFYVYRNAIGAFLRWYLDSGEANTTASILKLL